MTEFCRPAKKMGSAYLDIAKIDGAMPSALKRAGATGQAADLQVAAQVRISAVARQSVLVGANSAGAVDYDGDSR
jgi:hypothetical protein